jgi:uncharacterized membrane protein
VQITPSLPGHHPVQWHVIDSQTATIQASRGYLPVNAVEPERDRPHNFHPTAVLQEPIVNQSVSDSPANTSMVNVIYVLYLLALISGVTALIGVIMAYVYKDDGPEWLRSHYELQIRTFWFGLVVGAIGVLLSWVLIGVPILIALAVWWIIRCVKGLRYAGERAPYPNHRGWGL